MSIDIIEGNFTVNCSRSAVILAANPFVACYNNLTVWDSFAASLSDTENCLTIHFFGYPQDSPALRLADISSNSNENGLWVLAHDRPPTSTKAYERDHDTTRSVDVDTNWNELAISSPPVRNVSIIRNVYL